MIAKDYIDTSLVRYPDTQLFSWVPSSCGFTNDSAPRERFAPVAMGLTDVAGGMVRDSSAALQ